MVHSMFPASSLFYSVHMSIQFPSFLCVLIELRHESGDLWMYEGYLSLLHVTIYSKVKVKSLSHVRLFATLGTAVYQAPLSIGFSRQEY